MRGFLSVRGYIDHPCLIEVDLDSNKIIQYLRYPSLDLAHVPESKKGFSGLDYYDGKLYAATTDRICVIDSDSGEIEREISHKRFSDLHSIFMDQEGILWITSTNIDGIYCMQGDAVQPYWHAWNAWNQSSEDWNGWEDLDLRSCLKADMPFHQYHVNSVAVVGKEYVIASFLGSRKKYNFLERAGHRLGLLEKQFWNGGLFILSYKDKKLLKKVSTRGLHDTVLDKENMKLYSTEYFGNAISEFDIKTFEIKRTKLEVVPHETSGILSRGIIVDDNYFWVGHTFHRNKHSINSNTYLRKYSRNGKRLGDQIKIEGVKGIYDVVLVD